MIKAHHIYVKSHKLSILLSGFPPGTSISEIKIETLSALKSDVAPDALDVMAMEPPEFDVESEQDFELCRAVKEKGKPTGAFEVLDASITLRDAGLSGWETLFLQFRDRATGKQIFSFIFQLALCPNIYPNINRSHLCFNKSHNYGYYNLMQ